MNPARVATSGITDEPIFSIRPFDRVADLSAINGLDTSYTTDTSYEVVADGDALRLELVLLAASRPGRFGIDPDEPRCDEGWVAVENGQIIGFIATRFAPWNRRLVIWHFYVDRSQRGRGVGRTLLDQALAAGRATGALTAWVETNNQNVPGIAAYRRLGFALVGFDQTHYLGTSAADQFAIFLSRPLDI
jgi:ribosomal protein S18 acetylase RimI-like enzyme